MMEGRMRETGIDFLGPLPWGTHFCLFYETKEDLIDILVPYFKSGLENNEFCMWVTSEPLKAEEAKGALRRVVKSLDDYIEKGQIEILPYSQWYTKSGRFEADKVLQAWAEKESRALERGFDGLRLSGNTFWLEEKDWKDFADYEVWVNDVILEHRMLAICAYSLHRCGASEIMDVASSHQFAVIRHKNKWEAFENAEQRRTQEALRESEERYRGIFEQAADSIVLIDAETGTFVDFNDKAHASLGYTREEFKRFEIPDIEAIESAQEVANHIEKIVREGAGTFETKHRTKGGEIRDIQVSARTISIGGRDFVQSIWRDITERKQAEDALKEYSERLQEMVEERTKELEEAQEHLMRTEKLAATGRLAASVAHEINNPLEAVKNYLALLETKMAADDARREYVEQIEYGFNRIKEVVRRLLQFYRTDMQAMEPIDVNRTIESVLAICQRELALGKVKVTKKLGRGLPRVFASEGQLGQVLMNLFLNARDAMPQGGKLRLKTRAKGELIEIEVADTGRGISEEEMSHLFEPFYSTKEVGTGLGLWISYQIIQNHGGEMAVKSKVGKGTTFTISLPLAGPLKEG